MSSRATCCGEKGRGHDDPLRRNRAHVRQFRNEGDLEAAIVTDHPLDDETLAAFLDGRLSPPERARVLRVLAERPEVYADFIEAAQVAAELAAAAPVAQLAAEPQAPDVIPITRPVRRPWRGRLLAAIPLVAAAGIAGVLVLSPSSDAPSGRAEPDAIALLQTATAAPAQGTGSISARLGSRWDEPGWSVTRGAESSDASTGTIARIGARVAQLELAARASDTAAYRQVLATLRPLLETVTGASLIAARLAELPMVAADERATVVRQLREVAGAPEAFDAGMVLEAARLGIAGENPAFLSIDGAGVRALLATAAALERARPAGDWTATRAQLTSIAELGRVVTTASDQPRPIASPGALANAELRARVDSAVAAIPR